MHKFATNLSNNFSLKVENGINRLDKNNFLKSYFFKETNGNVKKKWVVLTTYRSCIILGNYGFVGILLTKVFSVMRL